MCFVPKLSFECLFNEQHIANVKLGYFYFILLQFALGMEPFGYAQGKLILCLNSEQRQPDLEGNVQKFQVAVPKIVSRLLLRTFAKI